MIRFSKLPSFLLLSCFVFSCDDSENEVPDTAAPEITIISPHEGSRVKGTIDITANAEDASREITLQVYVDDILIKEEASREIVAQLDTKTMSEGIHAIRITATDGLGNSQDKSFNIDVTNILLTIEVPSNYVEEYTTIYFILSRNDGSLLAYEKAENGKEILIPTPADFNPDSSFMFTEYFHMDRPGIYLINSVNVYAAMEAGAFKLAEVPQFGEVVGSHHLVVSGVPLSHEVNIGGKHTANVTGSFGTSMISTNINMDHQTSDLFFSLSESLQHAPVYKYMETIAAGGTTSFDFAGLPVMERRTVPLNGATNNYSVKITGYHDDSQRKITVFDREGTSMASELPLYFPATTFPKYRTEVSANIAGVDHKNLVVTAAPPATFQYLNAEMNTVSYTNGKLKIGATGNFDFGRVSASRASFGTSVLKLNAYTVTFPRGVQQVNTPQLPDQVLIYAMPSAGELGFSYAILFDLAAVNGLEDYQHKVVFSSDRQPLYEREGISKGVSFAPNPGGRLPSLQPRLPEALQLLKHHLPCIASGQYKTF